MVPTPRSDSGRSRPEETVLRGEPAAPGICVAPTIVFERRAVPVFRVEVRRREIGREIRRFTEARDRAAEQLREIRESTRRALGQDRAYLFEAQRLMLADPLLVDRVQEVIRSERVNAEWAVRTVLRELEAVFDGLADEYLRQRKGDIADVGGRLLQNLGGAARPSLERWERRHVVAADDLRPSDTAELDWTKIQGVIMEAGGPTYHTAILARTHDVPCVTGIPALLDHIHTDLPVVVDGSEGIVVVNPARKTVAEYRRKRERERERRRRLLAATASPARTANRERGVLLANRDHPGPLVIRAFDLTATDIGRAPELNPALGLRGARLLVMASGIFETQIRAVLRAAVHGRVQLMFPMVGGLEEFRAARTHVRAAVRALRYRDVPFREVPVGAMLEVPSAAATADLLGQEAEFLSIGTNDLMQYLFGVDRANERVAHFSDPLHPALLRTLRFVARVCRRTGLPLAVCGEVAAEPLMIPLLLGFGVRTFSMSPNAIPEMKRLIAVQDTRRAEEIAQQSVRLTTSRRVRARVLRAVRERSPAADSG